MVTQNQTETTQDASKIDCNKEATISGVLSNNRYKAIFGSIAGAIFLYVSAIGITDRNYTVAQREATENAMEVERTLKAAETEDFAKHAYKGFDCWKQGKAYSEDTEQCGGVALLPADITQNDALITHTDCLLYTSPSPRDRG